MNLEKQSKGKSTSINKNSKKKFEDELLEQEILDLLPIMAFEIDKKNNNNFFNKACVEFLGDFGFDCKVWVDRIHNADRSDFEKKYKSAVRRQKPFSVEFRILDKDNKHKWISLATRVRRNTDGEFIGFLGTAVDITTAKMVEMKKDEFLTIASHELKGPLTMIKGYNELSFKSIYEDDKEKTRQYIGKSIEGVDRLESLVSDLLDVSRIQTGKLEAHMELFNITELVKSLVLDTDQPIPTHKILLVEAENAYVSGDKLKLEQVISNLIDNAIKYSPNSDRVDIGVKKNKNHVVISITDYGIGIRKKDQQRIFRRFYRTEKSENNISGLGIGLYISKEIVALHNGKIKVKSELGKGSIFKVYLPVRKEG